MGKTWDTKKKIIKLVSKKNMTLSEISEELGLAASTVSKHIDELENMGALEQVDNPYIKKWKYYSANPEFDANRIIRGGFMVSRMQQIVAGTVILMAAAALLFVLFASGTAAAQRGNVAFQLTDPPQVPSGTQALLITYSSVQAHVVGSGNAGVWVNGTGSGSVDLMTLVNSSELIGSANLAANSTINRVSFTVTSARIDINGTYYNVTVPNNRITANVTGNVKSNGTILIDLSPVVATIYTANSTVFVMVPSVKAIAVAGRAVVHLGERTALTGEERDELNASSSLAISSLSISSSGNNTRISVTVMNNGNESVDVRHIMVFGGTLVVVYPDLNLTAENDVNSSAHGDLTVHNRPELNLPSVITGDIAGNSSAAMDGGASLGNSGSASAGLDTSASADIGTGVSTNTAGAGLGSNLAAHAGGNIVENTGNDMQGEVETVIRAAGVGVAIRDNMGNLVLHTGDITVFTKASEDVRNVDELVRVGITAHRLGVVTFMVASDGTLVLPSERGDFENQNFGYSVAAHSSATFVFSGQLFVGEGHLRINLVPGSEYKVVVKGEEGAFAIANVTAS